MDVRRLRYFSTLADVLHFGRAATRLGIAQPALSQQIKALGGEVGLPLFHRSSRGVALTKVGSAFRPYAVAVVAAADAAGAAAARLRDTRGRTLTLGVPANLPEHLLPDLLLALHDAAPELRVRTVGHSSAAQVAALQAGEMDAGLVRHDPGREGLAGRLVHCERVGVALPAGHRLAQADAVSAAQLSLLELITAPPAVMPGFHADLMHALTAAGWRGQVRESPDPEATLDLVAAGLGAAPMVATTAARHAGGRSGRLVWRPFDDVAVDSRLWCAWHPQRRSAAVETLLGALMTARARPGLPTDKGRLSAQTTDVLDSDGARGFAQDTPY